MLPRKNRVNRKTFDETLQKSRTFHSAYFSLRVRKDDTLTAPRFAVVVSKKVAKTAVARNLIKRRSREIFQALSKEGNGNIQIPTNTISILFFKKEGATLPFSLLKVRIGEVFSLR